MSYVHDTLESLRRSSPGQADFYQAAEEVLESLEPLIEQEPRYMRHGIIERIVEPERQIMFRVAWTDDEGRVRVNKGYRVQFSSSLGPYKGGLRFHPNVTAGVIKFLGFEQIFLAGKTCLVSGAGNVAIFTIDKLHQLGARPVTCSDSTGTLYHEAGIDLEALKQVKLVERGSLERYLEHHAGAEFTPVSDYPDSGSAVWRYKADAAFPCATQNELNDRDADALLGNGVTLVCEGANMPCTVDAVDRFLDAGIDFGPGKAANCGGVATSQLEMQQNAAMTQWSFEHVEERLRQIMKDVHRRASAAAEEFGRPEDLVMGANIAGFRRVADAMIEQGVF